MRKVRIVYEHFAANNAHGNRKFWTGIYTDTMEAFDYNPKDQLIKSCKKQGYPYEVIRVHRNGTTSVIEEG